MLTELEVWRIHPDRVKEAAAIELHNSLYEVIHPAYSKRTLMLETDDFVFKDKPVQVNTNKFWPLRAVHEMTLKASPDLPSMFIIRDLYLTLKGRAQLAIRY